MEDPVEGLTAKALQALRARSAAVPRSQEVRVLVIPASAQIFVAARSETPHDAWTMGTVKVSNMRRPGPST